MDFEVFIFDALGKSCIVESQVGIRSADDVRAVMAKMDEISGVSEYHDPIAWHVLAVLVMRGGGPLDLFKDEVLKAIEVDEWAAQDPKRYQAMQAFRAQVEGYVEGNATQVPTKGLLDTIHEHMAANKPGLVNVDPGFEAITRSPAH